ncbi:uncharacterized protein BJ171DRAFT_107653 [Polychytrium aggregatum]|uniref:uncharacterized protein n=1 Tax=Polychytrium aggregatum TaxID=110093 RepID=UPI0022FF2ADB|nr:uncharacterized protein BJ171DRAFT_107653 [Polychytrium aggregatum]KAI9204514.1 hypothetical protein BJ171DRAFT_107653 [Polychytrium aggregatum]
MHLSKSCLLGLVVVALGSTAALADPSAASQASSAVSAATSSVSHSAAGVQKTPLVNSQAVVGDSDDDDDDQEIEIVEPVYDPDAKPPSLLVSYATQAASWSRANIWWTLPMILAMLSFNVAYLFYALGSMHSEESVTVRAFVVRKPAAEVYESLVDFAAYPSWKPGCASVSVIEATKEGENARLVEKDLVGRQAIFEITEKVDNELLVYKTFHKNPEKLWASTEWTFEIEPREGNPDHTVVYIVTKDRVWLSIHRYAVALYGFDAKVHKLIEAFSLHHGIKKPKVFRPVEGQLVIPTEADEAREAVRYSDNDDDDEDDDDAAEADTKEAEVRKRGKSNKSSLRNRKPQRK